MEFKIVCNVSKRRGFLPLGKEIEEILYGEKPIQIECESLEQAKELKKKYTTDSTFAYITRDCIR